jgi:phytoene dehydrogenase-like protein
VSADPDVVVLGGGHNGLVAAAYLAGTGRRVTVLEARAEFGGAVAGRRVFPGVDARLSRFSYLVSLLPQQLIDELELDLSLRSRRIASYSPVGTGGLLIERQPGEVTRASFRAVTGSDAGYQAWVGLEHDLRQLAAAVAPTLLQPLPSAADVRAKVPDALWDAVTERPLAGLLESRFADDTVRGLLLTDALIGTFADAADPGLAQNRCFLYHVIGNGTGEWQVPVGGMGAVADALLQAAEKRGAELRASALVVQVEPLSAGGGRVRLADGSVFEAPYVLAGCAPVALARLRGEDPASPEGSQTKVNLVLRRLPQLRSGLDPATAFAGTLHLGQGYRRLAEAYAEAAAGRIPDSLPCEVYCHTLTDDSILAPELAAQGWHTLTLFGLHTPARLFAEDPAGARRRAGDAALRALQHVLAEPLEDCLALDGEGRPCVEVMTPLDVERELSMPGGHIFHGDLQWPWLADGADNDAVDAPATSWGVATDHAGILLCGSGAVRGGAVSGIGGQNAAMAVLADG